MKSITKTLFRRYSPAALVPVLWLASCSRPHEPFRVAGNAWPGYAPLYVAQGMNYFKGTGIEVYNLPNAVEVMRAYRNRAIDVAAVTADEALVIAQTDPEQRIILVCDYSLGADMVVAASTIGGLRELRGKRIGVESGALGAYVLDRALGTAGLEPRDVTVVTCEMENMEQALVNGDIMAAVVYEPFAFRLLGKGAHRVFDSRQIPEEIVDVLVTRKSTIESSPTALQALVTNWFKALDFIHRHPDQAAQFAQTHGRIDAATFVKSLSGIALVDRAGNGQLLAVPEKKLKASLVRLEELMRREKLLFAPVKVEDIPEGRFVR